jgi:fibronectin-binding autotransporter adhesin
LEDRILNHIYRLVWNRKLRVWQAASELATQSRGGRSSAPCSVATRMPRYAAGLALAFGLTGVSAAVQAACTVAGVTVTCTGAANPGAPSFASNANMLNVTVDAGATVGVDPTVGGTAMSLTGSNATLTNFGRIDANLLGTSTGSSAGLVVGDTSASTIRISNMASGTLGGVVEPAAPLPTATTGLALAVQNGIGGVSHLSNAGMIQSSPSANVNVSLADLPVIAAYGGGQVDFVNQGMITGRIGFQASGTPGAGHSFVNAGTIVGGVSLGQGGNNTYTAVSGSILLRGNAFATADLPVTGTPGLTFAPSGKVDAGTGAGDTLVLQNVLPSAGVGSGTGGGVTSISGSTYINFDTLRVNSGSWNLEGTLLNSSGIAELNGGLANLADGGALGTAEIHANGGTLALNMGGQTLVNNIVLGAQGLQTTGASDYTLSGNLSGVGGVNVAGTAPITFDGVNNYTGGTTIQSTSTLVGDTRNLQGNITNQGALTFRQTAAGTFAGAISGSGTLTKEGAGTLTLTGANSYTGATSINAGGLVVGAGGSLGSGAINLATGTVLTLQNTGNHTVGSLAGASALVQLGSGTLILDSTASTTYSGQIFGMGALVKENTGTQTLNGSTTAIGGITINGGTLALGASSNLASNTALTVNTSGTFDQSSIANQTLASLNGSGGNVKLGAGNLTVGAGAYSGQIEGTGGLIKTGSGSLSLNGINSYTGLTQVSGGTLLVGASAANSNAAVNGNISVANTATLGGFGRVNGDVAVQAGGRLAPGAPAGVFTVNGNLTLAQGSLAEFSMGAPGVSHSVSVNGNLQLNGVQLSALDTGGFGAGVYRLFDYTGSLTLANGGLTPAAGLAVQYLSGSRQVNLINTAGSALNFWNANGLASPTNMGGGSGVWSLNGANWTDATGGVTGPRHPADAFAIFGGAAGTVVVDGTAGAISAQGIQFTSDGYHLTGDALALPGATPGALGEVRVGDGSLASASWTTTIDNVLTGTGINKTGLGTLVLNGANTITQTTRLSAGTLSVSSDANLGASTAALDFQGGTLRVTGTAFQNTPRTIALGGAGGGFDIADAGNTFTVNQALAGNGSLAKLGQGTLVLVGANTYMGGTKVQAGTLQVGDGAVSGSIAGNVDIAGGGTLAFARSDRVVFDGLVSGAGRLRQAGTGALVLTGQNTYTGNTLIDSGTLQVGDGGTTGFITGNIVNQGSLVFNRSDDIVYAGAMSGTGGTTKLGAGALVLTGDSGAYTGTTQLSAGTLQVDGKLGGNVLAASGTTLAGTGSLNSVTLGSGATLAPGNAATPQGRMTLSGDLIFKPGSTYRITTTANGQNSSVQVAGAASLGGSVVQVGENGNYAASTTYTILSANNGVQGRFDTVSSNLAFLTPSLSYDSNRVDLVVNLKDVPSDGGGTRPIEFADAAVTGNQRSVAGALQSLPTDSVLYQHILNLPNGAPPAAFNALSGEAHASTLSVLQNVSSSFTHVPMTRLQANLNAGQLPGAPTAQLGMGDAASLPQSAAQPLWTQVFGKWTTLAGDGNSAKTTQSDAGVTIGGDVAVGGGWRLGGAVGYANSDSRTRERASSADTDSYSIAVYGGKAFDAGAGKINVSLGAAYSWHDVDTQRSTAAAGLDQTLKASYGASTGQFFTELGYATPVNEHLTLEPFIAANYSDLRTRGFSESGGDAALRGQSSRNDITTTTLGLHALTTFDSAGARGYARGTLGWRHAFGDLNPASVLAFAQGGDSFTATGTPVARDAVVVEVGVGIDVSKRTTVGVSYGGQFGDGNRQNIGTLDVRYRF